jgi:hypothetical protein
MFGGKFLLLTVVAAAAVAVDLSSARRHKMDTLIDDNLIDDSLIDDNLIDDSPIDEPSKSAKLASEAAASFRSLVDPNDDYRDVWHEVGRRARAK